MAPRLARLIALAALGGLLTGCAATRSAQETGEEKPAARYSSAAGVALHESPDAASAVVGKLALHEGVLRTRIENGFAYVRSEKTGSSGWVREGQLVERIPAAKKEAAKAPSAAPESAATPVAAEPSAEPIETVEPAEPVEQAEPVEPDEPPAEGHEKSIFDPYF